MGRLAPTIRGWPLNDIFTTSLCPLPDYTVRLSPGREGVEPRLCDKGLSCRWREGVKGLDNPACTQDKWSRLLNFYNSSLHLSIYITWTKGFLRSLLFHFDAGTKGMSSFSSYYYSYYCYYYYYYYYLLFFTYLFFLVIY